MRSSLVVVTLGLLLLEQFTWMVVLRPHSSLLLNLLYSIATVLMIWSYVRAMTSRPATTSQRSRATSGVTEQETRYCERCDAEKAPYVHHCSVCKQCVYRMDHHCPWTGNCVAWHNKKVFLLFLLYTALSCWAFNVMASPLVHETDLKPYKVLLQCCWGLTAGIGVLVAGYFMFHLWLLRQGKTTLEFLAGKRGELAGGSFVHNATVYFGRNGWTWWLPIDPILLDAASGGGTIKIERDEGDNGEEDEEHLVVP